MTGFESIQVRFKHTKHIPSPFADTRADFIKSEATEIATHLQMENEKENNTSDDTIHNAENIENVENTENIRNIDSVNDDDQKSVEIIKVVKFAKKRKLRDYPGMTDLSLDFKKESNNDNINKDNKKADGIDAIFRGYDIKRGHYSSLYQDFIDACSAKLGLPFYYYQRQMQKTLQI